MSEDNPRGARVLQSWESMAQVQADCLTCGRRPKGGGDGVTRAHRDVFRRWARHHAEANPGHHVIVETTKARSYRAGDPADAARTTTTQGPA